jgi:hypothetical protein
MRRQLGSRILIRRTGRSFAIYPSSRHDVKRSQLMDLRIELDASVARCADRYPLVLWLDAGIRANELESTGLPTRSAPENPANRLCRDPSQMRPAAKIVLISNIPVSSYRTRTMNSGGVTAGERRFSQRGQRAAPGVRGAERRSAAPIMRLQVNVRVTPQRPRITGTSHRLAVRDEIVRPGNCIAS